LLEWAEKLNPLACGLKCAWKISTVSPSYMEELRTDSNGLEFLFELEAGKSVGLLNGIDPEVWNPATDTYLDQHYTLTGSTEEHPNCLDVKEGKSYHKHALCQEYQLSPDRPLFAFIGRLVDQKGADLLASVIRGLRENGKELNFILLGTGDAQLEAEFRQLDQDYVGYFNAKLSYNEGLARQMYAGADFMVMPSRVEPCGLNQLYAMRYGTIPIVRSVGGLKDSVPDISSSNGLGIQFEAFSYEALEEAILRASDLFTNKGDMHSLRERIMVQDHSWEKVAKEYDELYIQLQSYRD
jgi:starch synthase